MKIQSIYSFGLISGAASSGFNWSVSLFEGNSIKQNLHFKTHSGMCAAMQGFGLMLSKGRASFIRK